MKSYKKDVINYVDAMDKVLKELVEKRNTVIRNYNEDVHEYNKDDFFHRGSKLKPIKLNEFHHHAPMVTKENHRENVQTLKASTTDTWTDSDNVEETITTLLNPDTTRKTTHKHSSSISSSKTKSEEKTKKRGSSVKVKYPKYNSNKLSDFIEDVVAKKAYYDEGRSAEEEALSILIDNFLKR